MFPVNGSLRTAPRFPRSGPGESGSPMSQVLLRCYDFPPRISGHLFASLPGSTRSSSLRVSQLALPVGSEGTSGPGPLFNRRPKLPVRSHVDVNGTSQVPRRSILCLCPALRPRPNRRSLASLTVSSMLPPHFPRRRLQRSVHAKLASGWLARLYREGVEPSGSLQKVSDHPSSFSGLSLAQGKFHFEPPFTSLDHLVGAGEQRRRHVEACLILSAARPAGRPISPSRPKPSCHPR